MSRTNPHATIVSEEQLVPSANRLVIKKNNQRVASDSDITNTMLRFVVGILRHHKLYKPVSLTATIPVIYLQQFWTTINHNSNTHSFTFHLDTQTFTLNARLLHNVLQMPQPDSNKPYTKPPTENKILGFIMTLGYDEDLIAKMTNYSTIVATILHQPWRDILNTLGIVHSANLDFASLIWDEFEWQAVDRSDFEMHSEGQDLPLTKLTNTVKGTYIFGMEKTDTMINDAFKKSAGYKYYRAKKAKSKKAKAAEEPEEQHVSPMKSRREKGYMRLSDQDVNIPIAFKKNAIPRKTRSLIVANNIVKEPVAVELAKSISHIVEDPDAQLLLDLRKGSKTSRLESMKQAKQAVTGEGSSAAHNKYYEFKNISATDSEATQDSYCSDTDEERDDETDDSDDSNMDLSEDEPKGDDDAVGFGVFVYNKSTEPLKSTYLSSTITTSSLGYIQTFLNNPPANELTDFMSNLVYTDAHITSTVIYLEGNPELTSYTSGASEVPFGTHVDVQAINIVLWEMFPDEAKKNMRKIKFKRAVTQRFKEYDQKLEALISINVSEAIDKAVHAKVLTKMKKLLPTHVLKVLANYLNLLDRIHLNKTHPTYQKLYDNLYDSILLDQEALDAQEAEPSFYKQTHDHQDPPTDREREKRKKR
ncbi:hypothetical protein Tco_0894149 [Tanacetum coccineum]|uniref:Uncharacterized protein n=1 Tax=Tanacetum coccineum TaxID=301880 RepID=A0ABQ5CDR2_9ASTR